MGTLLFYHEPNDKILVREFISQNYVAFLDTLNHQVFNAEKLEKFDLVTRAFIHFNFHDNYQSQRNHISRNLKEPTQLFIA